MTPTHIEHIGIAVNDLSAAIALYEKTLGIPCLGTEEVKDQKVMTAFFKVGQTKIELLAPTSPDSPIGKFLEKKGEGIHHIAFAVNGLDGTLREMEAQGVQLIDREPRKGAEGLNIAFLHPKATRGVLVELCEQP